MCDCVNVHMGSYDNQVVLIVPKHMLDDWKKWTGKAPSQRKSISVDRCIADEIKWLWNQGIITTGNCCGHNTSPAYVGVIDEHIQKMKELGYKVQFNQTRQDDEDSFDMKSVESPTVEESYVMRFAELHKDLAQMKRFFKDFLKWKEKQGGE